MNINIPSKISQLSGYPITERSRLTNKQFDEARAELEELIQWALPSEYLTFVRDYGLYAVEATVAGQEMPVAIFLGFNPDFPDDPYNLVRAYSLYRERIPKGTLGVALDDYGSLFLLDLKTGEVLFFDHETEHRTLIATDFNRFLELLEPLPDDDLGE